MLVLCTPEQQGLAQRAADLLGGRFAGRFAGAVMHVPIEIAREARALAARLGADCAVAIGGGSTIGLGKAIALESPLPIVAIPTTYAGSEMTPIYGITVNGDKQTGRSPQVLPRAVLYDPDLSASLPVPMSTASGVNAIAHCVEALYAADGNPVTSLMAEEGIRALADGLPRIVANAGDMAARSACLYGAWLAGSVLGSCAVALHHKLCHTIGGSFDLPHAETHTIVLPHALAYNAVAVPDAMARIARAIGGDAADVPGRLFDMAARQGVPVALRDIGMRETDIEVALERALANPYWNPRQIEREPLRALLQAAYAGTRPS